MNKGIKKITYAEGPIIPNKSSQAKATIQPDEFVWFKIAEWEKDTTEKDKKEEVTWIRQTADRKVIINQLLLSSTKKYGIKLPKKLCGPNTYYIEASLSGKRDLKKVVGIKVQGYCPELIVASKWCTSNDGSDVRKSHKFSYGEPVFLNLDTEGLNGARGLVIEVYNRCSFSSDKKIATYTNIWVTDGEVNLKIDNTAAWQGLIDRIKDEEEFYIKIKDNSGQYIKDANEDDIHGRYLRIENKLVSNQPKPPTNLTPLKVGKQDIKAERYEPCKFDSVAITETQKKDGKVEQIKVVLFEKGTKVILGTPTVETIQKTVFFEFDQTTLSPQSNETLSNTLNFLLSHKHSTVTLNGYACVIGPEDYNRGLSERRSEAIKKFFTDGGLDARRIVTQAMGEVQMYGGKVTGGATDDKAGKDSKKYRNEKDYIDARRVDILFKFYGHNAQTIVYETIAPAHDKVSLFKDGEIIKFEDKTLLVDVSGWETKKCFRGTDKHTKKIVVTSAEYKEKEGKKKDGETMQVPVHCDLAFWNVAPLQYLWPKWNLINGIGNKGLDSATQYFLHVHSCRYFTDAQNTTVLIKVYPDIKWNLQLAFNFTNPSAYTHGNLPEYSRTNPKDDEVKEIIRKNRNAQGKATAAGKETAKIKNSPELLSKFELKLEAKWNNDAQKFELGFEFAEKVRGVLSAFLKYKQIADKVKDTVGGAVKKSPLSPPFMFEVQAPSLNTNIDWYLEKGKDKFADKVATVGKWNFKADPLIGAQFVVDLLAVASRMHPFVTAMIKGTELALSALNGGITFEAKFYGKLSFDFKALEINSLTGMKGSSLDLGAEMGVEINLKISFSVKYKSWFMEVEVKLRAEGVAKAYFAAKIQLDSDEKGIFYKPELGFSGLIFTFEAEIVVGGFKRLLKFGNEKEPFLKADVPDLEKKYFL